MSGRVRHSTARDERQAEAVADDCDDVIEAPLWDVPKSRRCLRCETSFQSAWSGERICPQCKRSQAWRRGEPAPSSTPGKR